MPKIFYVGASLQLLIKKITGKLLFLQIDFCINFYNNIRESIMKNISPLTFKKIITITSIVIIMGLVGGIYAWSIFISGLERQYGFTTTQSQLIFGLTIASFTITMILAGRLETKFSPRLILITGGFLFLAGYLIAAFSVGNFLLVLFGIGIISGMGIGSCYMSSLILAMRIYPEKKGLISGIAVGGFGAGAILTSFIVDFLYKINFNLNEIFIFISLAYGSAIIILSLSAENIKSKESNSSSLKDIFKIIKDRRIAALSLGIFSGTFSGLLIIGNLKKIGISYGIDAYISTLSISVLSIGNMSGRIFWGFLSDKIGGDLSIKLSLLFQALLISSVIAFNNSPIAYLIVVFLIGLGFGSNFVLYARETAEIFGVDKVGTIYPYIFLFYGVAGIAGPTIGGKIYDYLNSYSLALLISSLICLTGLLLYYYTISKEIKAVESH